MRTTAWAIGGLLLGGCFTDAGGTAGSASNGSSEGPGSSSSGTPTEATASASSTDATSGAPTTTGDTSAGDSSASSSTTGGGEGAACDPWAPMCADGFKCAAYASDDGNAWDATKCTKVTGEGKPGGGCVVEDSPTSGIDSCEPGAMCWGVEPDMTGTCYALCTGSPENAVCPPGSSCFQTNEGVVNVCVIDCDPLEADCTPGHVCVPDPMTLQFVCLPPANNLEVGSPCGFTNDCAPGLVCWDPSLMPSTCADAEGCCLQYCDTAKQECPDTQECMPFFVKDTAPPGLETLGLCAEAP